MTYKILSALCVFFLLPIFLLSGCLGEEKPKDIVTDFSSDFKADYREMTVEGHISANRQRVVNIRVDTPSTLGGIEFNYKSSEMQIKRDNMICSADEAYIPESSFPNILKTILYDISDGRAVPKSNENSTVTYNLKTVYGNAVLTQDANGFLKSAELRDKQFLIEFKNPKQSSR